MKHPAPVMLPGNPFETLLLVVALLGGIGGLAAGVSVPAVDTLTPALTVPFNALLVAAGTIGLVAAVCDAATGLLVERVAMGLLGVLLATWGVLTAVAGAPVLTTVGVFAHAAAVAWRLWQNLRDIHRLRGALAAAAKEATP